MGTIKNTIIGHQIERIMAKFESARRWSAKITVWNEAMYYFAIAPPSYRKIFFVLRDVRAKTGESLAEYYVRTYRHLIPSDVEVWEYDQETTSVKTH